MGRRRHDKAIKEWRDALSYHRGVAGAEALDKILV